MDVFGCLLLAFLLHQASCASSGSDMTGAEGRSVTFHLQNLKGENLAWSFCGESILAFKLVKPLEATFFDNSYKSRVAFPEDGSALTISQLRRSDAGTYVARNTEFRANFTLRVYSELLEPTVTCVSQNCSADGCRYTLRCAAEPPGDKAFFWSNGEQPWGEGPEVVLETSPPGGSDPLLYTCTVQNPVSSRNATISPSALCAENTTRTPAAGRYSSSHAGIIAALVVGVLVVLVSILAIIKSKGRKDHGPPVPGAPSTEVAADCMTVYAEVGTSQQVQTQNFPKAQKNDPKKMPAPGMETPKTIYSTIQAMAQRNSEMGNSTPGCWEPEKSLYSSESKLGPPAQEQPQHGSNMPMSLL